MWCLENEWGWFESPCVECFIIVIESDNMKPYADALCWESTNKQLLFLMMCSSLLGLCFCFCCRGLAISVEREPFIWFRLSVRRHFQFEKLNHVQIQKKKTKKKIPFVLVTTTLFYIIVDFHKWLWSMSLFIIYLSYDQMNPSLLYLQLWYFCWSDSLPSSAPWLLQKVGNQFIHERP